ncbi:MAG TPA: hypothetical protein VJ144_03425 [Candidatus Polarisedimenticolia bacterium]|nr:hypothetical protein [Candidatus Polarisedimenticolia bacterium]
MRNLPIRRPGPRAALTTAVILLLCAAGETGAARRNAPPPCAADLKSCPEQGCADAGTSEAYLNQLKRTWPAARSPVILTLEDFQRLQEQADGLVGQGVPLGEKERRKLRGLRSRTGRLGEGDLVQVRGYIVGQPAYARGAESVNCRLTGAANSDFRVTLAAEPDATEFDGITVVMIPHWRPVGWTLARLARLSQTGSPVMVLGQLFYDSEHKVNDDPDQEVQGQPKRVSLWEIHPVTDVYVCRAKDRNCDVHDLHAWDRLELGETRATEPPPAFPRDEVQEESIK